MSLFRQFVMVTLRELDLPYLFDTKRLNSVILPIPLEGYARGFALGVMTVNDEACEVTIETGICRVPYQRERYVLWLLNRLNRRPEYRFVKWQLVDDVVVVTTHVDLANRCDYKKALRFALFTVLDACKAEWHVLVQATTKRLRRSRLDQELTSILDRLQVEQ